MKTATRAELQRALKQDQLEPLYLLFGCEGFLRDESVREITDTALRGTLLREFNETTFSSAERRGAKRHRRRRATADDVHSSGCANQRFCQAARG